MKPFTLIVATAVPMLGFVGAQTCAPSGTHLKSGSETCHCNPDGSVTCDSFQLCGVGNTNANALLTSSFTATVQCQNKGGQIVDVKTQAVSKSASANALAPKNGCLTVPPLSTTRPTDQEFKNAATCPNPNWTKVLEGGTVSDSYSFTLTFAGFSCPYVPLSGTCPG